MDISVDLGEEFAGGDVGLLDDVLDGRVELLYLLGCAQLDAVIVVDVLDELDLPGGLFGAFKQLCEGQLVRHHVLVEVHVVNHV